MEVKQDYAAAMKAYLQAAERNYGKADERIAAMYERGLGVPIDKAEALRWVERSAKLGNASAIYTIGQMYQKGIGVNVDTGRAVKQFELAATGKDVPAMLALGALYRDGVGVAMNKKTAYSWYLVALNFDSAAGGSQAKTLQASLTDEQVTAGRENAKRQLRSLLHTRFVVPE